MTAPNFQAEHTKTAPPRHLEIAAAHAAAIADLLRLQAIRAGLVASSIAEIPMPGDDAVIASMFSRLSRASDVLAGAA